MLGAFSYIKIAPGGHSYKKKLFVSFLLKTGLTSKIQLMWQNQKLNQFVHVSKTQRSIIFSQDQAGT